MDLPQTHARQRALLILQVQAGQITATAAARQLGLSRKSYYQWERRALTALLESVEQQAPGRPPKETDMEKEQLRQRVALLERKITEMERIRELRQTMQQLQAPGLDAKKNSRSCKPSSTKPPPPRPPLG